MTPIRGEFLIKPPQAVGRARGRADASGSWPRGARDASGMNREADNPAGELNHEREHPSSS